MKLLVSNVKVDKVFIKLFEVFSDFLVFYQDICRLKDTPLYTIEETKTDDKESRNTGVYQRCSSFSFKIIIRQTHNALRLQVGQKEKPTKTYIFELSALTVLKFWKNLTQSLNLLHLLKN